MAEKEKKKTASKPAVKQAKKPATKQAKKPAGKRAGNDVGNGAGSGKKSTGASGKVKSNRRRKHRVTEAEKISKIDYSEVEKIQDIKKLEKMFTTLRQGYVRRKKSLEKVYKYIPAVEGIEKYRDVYRGNLTDYRKKFEHDFEVMKQVTNITDKAHDNQYVNALHSQINQYQQFFRNMTSTKEGMEKWRLEQDKRIFGMDKNGIPIQSMDDDTRKNFWAVYNEYRMNHNSKNLDSDQVQKLLEQLYNENIRFEVTPDMMDMITAKYEVSSNIDYIRQLFDEYSYTVDEYYGKRDEHISQKDKIDEVINTIIEYHFPLYKGSKSILFDEIKNRFLEGEFGSGSTVYSGRRDY